MKARIVFAVLLGSILFAPRAAAEPPAVFIKLLYGNYTNMDHWAKGYDPCREYCEDDFAKLLEDKNIQATIANIAGTSTHLDGAAESIDDALRPWRERAGMLKTIVSKAFDMLKLTFPVR